MDAMKTMTLGGVAALATWICAYAIGETVDNLIGWFDKWSDDEKNEGQ